MNEEEVGQSSQKRFLKYCQDASLYKINHKKDLDSKIDIGSMANKVVKKEGPNAKIGD